MLTVEIRIYNGGVDLSSGILIPPHSFLVATGHDGVERGYGFAPDPSGLVQFGHVQDDSNHASDVSSGKAEITQAQYDSLMNYINTTKANPPVYAAFYGSQCSTWVVNALAQMGMVPALGVPDMQPSNMLVDFVESLIFNPWIQATGIEESKFLTSIQNLFHQAEITKSPLVLDLNGDGVGTIAKSAGVHFDQNNNRFSELTGWVEKDDGLLVRDLNSNGQIDGGGELFGDNTLLTSGQKAANGFAALAEADANLDGNVDGTEATVAGIKIWKDANQNGLTDAEELLTLNQAGVSSLATNYTAASVTDAQGNRHSQTGHYTAADGTIHGMDDVWFDTDTARTIEKDTVAVSAQIAALPDMPGFGNVHSLHQAMARDSTGHLQSLVEQFTASTDAASRKVITTQLIYAWAGVENVDPNSRAASMIYGNVIGDARKLASLEALLGESYVGVWCWGTRDPNPHGQAAPVLLQAFDTLVNYVTTTLERSSIRYLYNSVGIAWDASAGLHQTLTNMRKLRA